MRLTFCAVGFLLAFSSFAKEINPVESIFSQEQTIQMVLHLEAAMAQAQAELKIIPQWAADEISKTANQNSVSVQEWQQENNKVHANLVAILNVWTKKMEPKAAEYVHFGATTVDDVVN